MKSINENDYKKEMGVLIDVQSPISYLKSHNPFSINIYYDKLIMNHESLLNKNNKYYLICKNGNLSKKAARILEYFGYDVTYVINR